MKVETFKCATGAGWGILVDGKMDCSIPYTSTEEQAVEAASLFPRWMIVTTKCPEHYSNQPRKREQSWQTPSSRPRPAGS